MLSSRPARVLHKVDVPFFGHRDMSLQATTEFRNVEKQLLDMLYAPGPGGA